MGQLVVRNLENEIKARLQLRAKRHGHSMEEEVRDILRNAVHAEEMSSEGLGTAISRLFSVTGLSTDLPEFRGHSLKPVDFQQ